METVKEILMRRDGISAAEAQLRIDEAQELINEIMANSLDADAFEALAEIEDVIKNEFGLEPDYVHEFLIL